MRYGFAGAAGAGFWDATDAGTSSRLGNAGIGALSTALGVIGAANPLVATISAALAAASVLLPVIETAFNIFLPATPAPVLAADHRAGRAAAVRFAAEMPMTPARARQVLAGILA